MQQLVESAVKSEIVDVFAEYFGHFQYTLKYTISIIGDTHVTISDLQVINAGNLNENDRIETWNLPDNQMFPHLIELGLEPIKFETFDIDIDFNEDALHYAIDRKNITKNLRPVL